MFRVKSVSQAARRFCHSYPASQPLLPGHRLVARRLTSTTTVKTNTGSTAWMASVAIAAVGTSFLLSSAVQAEAARSETIEEPMTNMQFPLTIHNGTDQKVILGLGSRQVSFLKMNVYVMGMYISVKDARVLRKAGIWTDAQAAMDSMDHAQQMLKQPIDIAIRIVPTRATGGQHLRDGFTRSLLQLMRDHSKELTEDDERQILEGIQDFKAKFPSTKVNKGDEFIFTRTANGGLKIEFRGKELGTVKNRWVADNFVVGYVKLGIVKNVLEDDNLK
ncbi:hypothetical protein NQZ79_g2613 [Umbelopsis isabellina]|nr:hypothetical protein NQZ79_g2613 [Umbelopsis isabellina]